MGSHRSLTTPPTNLKDAIDWLALVGGGFGKNDWGGSGKPDKLEAALDQLPGFDEIKSKVFGEKLPQGAIKALADGLGYGFLGYEGSESFGSSGIVDSKKQYKSAYGNAQWPEDEPSKQQCALIFLGASVTVFYSLTYFYWKCKLKVTINLQFQQGT
ncbi:variant erythrocyte surface antigen-1 family protein [Babesia caballi]|uniref:Variant erythrocyte surface antigen-1 family protein n=1 Tax=Babesia caballi TaxID=5871 RepID=A0AAV4LMU8_BABCB|nr:variant erythrocyte surface antigen-1 family protein [Babesia caballi]